MAKKNETRVGFFQSRKGAKITLTTDEKGRLTGRGSKDNFGREFHAVMQDSRGRIFTRDKQLGHWTQRSAKSLMAWMVNFGK